MEFWTISAKFSDVLLDVGIVSLLLLVGAYACKTVHVLRRFLIPGSLFAGFLGFIIGPESLQVIGFSTDRMGVYVYHLLALTFIGVGLQSGGRKVQYSAVHLGFMQVVVMVMQGILGLGIALIASMILFPDLKPATGLLLPLGFAMGPGIAYSIGSSWSAFGFGDAASIGLSISAIGFVFAYVTGVMITTQFLKSRPSIESIPDDQQETVAREKKSWIHRLSIEPLSIHLALFTLMYALTFVVASGLAWTLRFNGLEQEVPIVWSFHFIIANLIALGTKAVLVRLGKDQLIDRQLLRKTTSTIADYLIAASVMAISMQITWSYAVPVLLMCVTGALLTYLLLKWASYRVFTSYQFERFVGMYAQMTGTISSGLALIRVTDPAYKTPVAEDLVLSSGIALAFGFPLLLLINMPFTVFSESTRGYVMLLLILITYLVLTCLFWYVFLKRSKKSELA